MTKTTKILLSKRSVLYLLRMASSHPPEYVAKEIARILGARGGRARAKGQTAAERKALAAKGGKASKGKKNGRKKRKKKKSETDNKP